MSLTDARPPTEVEADFAAAQSAESERDRRINEAKSYDETTTTAARAAAREPGSKEPMPAAERTVLLAARRGPTIHCLAGGSRPNALSDDAKALHGDDAVAALPRETEGALATRRRRRLDSAGTPGAADELGSRVRKLEVSIRRFRFKANRAGFSRTWS